MKVLLPILFHRLRHTVIGRRAGYAVALTLVLLYGVVALRGPQGIPALLDKRREIRQLEEQNAAMTAEIERRKERIQRLEQNPAEQEMEIRRHLKLLRPGETTFLIPEAPKENVTPQGRSGPAQP